MAKLLCRCSMLKSDDARLRNMSASFKWCELCDIPEIEDARHMVIRCPTFQTLRVRMFSEMCLIAGDRADLIPDSMDELFNIVMGD